MRSTPARLAACVLLIFASCGVAEGPKDVLIEVSTEDLQKQIDRHRGKVVLVDIWAEYCIPCRKKFPLLTRLQRDFAEDGLVVITVTIDEKADREKAIEFLNRAGMGLRNMHLIDTDANVDRLDKRMAVKAPPIVHLFDREGKRTSFETGIKDDQIEAKVRELLRAK